MADDLDNGRLRRKRRKLGRKDEDVQAHQEECVGTAGYTTTSSPPAYDFLHLASLILEHEIPIICPGSERPRNAYALIGADGSFLVFKKERTMDNSHIRPE